MVAGGILAGGWALAETHRFRLRQETVPVLTPGAPPRRLLHLSDIHLVPGQRHKRRWLTSLAELKPDLVVTTGDFLSHRLSVPAVLDALGTLLDRPGLFVLGSNDYVTPKPINPANYLRGPSALSSRRPLLPWRDLVVGLTRSGWIDLSNGSAELALPGWTVAARGVDDPHIQRDRYQLVAGPFPAGADLRLGVTHAPYVAVVGAMAHDGADLILAGHTHGGQVRIPGYGALVTNCDLDRRHAKGLSRVPSTPGAAAVPGDSTSRPPHRDAAWLHVSAGIGSSPYAPIRFACPPEATLLTLVSRSPDGL